MLSSDEGQGWSYQHGQLLGLVPGAQMLRKADHGLSVHLGASLEGLSK